MVSAGQLAHTHMVVAEKGKLCCSSPYLVVKQKDPKEVILLRRKQSETGKRREAMNERGLQRCTSFLSLKKRQRINGSM